MNALIVLSSLAFIVTSVQSILMWSYFWQLKEYRFDRMRVHLLETLQGRRLLFSFSSLTSLILILSYGFTLFDRRLLFPYQLAVAVFFFFRALFAAQEAFARRVNRPTVTPKAVLIVVATFGLILSLMSISLVEYSFWLLILDRAVAPLVGFFVFLLMFPTEVFFDLQIEKAARYLRRNRRLTVIGITGSYGKSSTKECIAQVLQKRFRVVRTAGSQNTPAAIARTILRKLRHDTEIFIVEMGAYRKGEIKELCNIVRPTIAVISGVSNQHLSLFGSIKKTMEAKYELIESLPTNGLALFNGNDDKVRLLYEQTRKKKVLFGVEQTGTPRFPIQAENVRVGKTFVVFDVRLGRRAVAFRAPLIGKQSVLHILAAILLANYLGMDKKTIQEAVHGLLPLNRTMVRKPFGNGVTFIDNTFSANPDGISCAIDYMQHYDGRKILVLSPLIELGSKAQFHHYEIGRLAGSFCDYLLLTNGNFFPAILRGIRDTGRGCLAKVAGTSEIATFVRENTRNGDVVVFEGREALRPLDMLLQKT